jgi:hypothetical protein
VPDGPERDAVMARVVEAELRPDPERKGAAVIIDVTRMTNLRGDDVE